jgi:hypothetical protein
VAGLDEPRGDHRLICPDRPHTHLRGAAADDRWKSPSHRDQRGEHDWLRPWDRVPVPGHLGQRPSARQVGFERGQDPEARDLHRRHARPFDQTPAAKRRHDLVLAPRDLQVAVDPDGVERRPAEGVEHLGEGERVTACRVPPVVRDEQRGGAWGNRPRRRASPIGPVAELGPRPEHVQLDHLRSRLDRRLEALERVPRPDRVGALVTDPLQARHDIGDQGARIARDGQRRIVRE